MWEFVNAHPYLTVLVILIIAVTVAYIAGVFTGMITAIFAATNLREHLDELKELHKQRLAEVCKPEEVDALRAYLDEIERRSKEKAEVN